MANSSRRVQGRRLGLLSIISALLISAAAAKELPPAGTTGRMLQQLESSDDWILRAEALHFLSRNQVEDSAPTIRRLLADEGESPWLRGRALVAIAQLDGEAPDLSGFIKHERSELRAAAFEVCERFPAAEPPNAFNLLEDEVAYKNEMAEVRFRALAAYAKKLGEGAGPIVNLKTHDPPPEGIEWAARAMAHVGTENELGRLVDLASLEKNRPHLPKIIRGIGELPYPKLIPVLLKILADNEAMLPQVLSSLQHRDEGQLIAALDKELDRRDESVTRAVATVIARLVQVPELGLSLRRALADVEDVDTIRAGLIALGSSSMEPDLHRDLFGKYLNHDEVEIRSLAIRCLAHCEEANLFDEFRESLGDEEPPVVHAVLAALLRAPVATAPRGQMVDYLQAPLVGKDDIAREMAYQLLGQVGGDEDFRPAMTMLGHLLRGKDEELRKAAAEALGKIAPDDNVEEVVRAQGFLAKWRVVGTFFNDAKHTGFHEKLLPELDGEIDFETTYPSEYVWVIEHQTLKDDQEKIEREVAWAEADLDETDGTLFMSTELPPPGSYSVGFAVADFEVDLERDVLLSISGDDAFRVWLNGELVTEAIAEYKRREPCVAQKLNLPIKLPAGENRLLIKTANIDHQWWLRVRITDPEGNPIELSTP